MYFGTVYVSASGKQSSLSCQSTNEKRKKTVNGIYFLQWKGLPLTNALAYYAKAAVKNIVKILTSETCDLELFTAVISSMVQ